MGRLARIAPLSSTAGRAESLPSDVVGMDQVVLGPEQEAPGDGMVAVDQVAAVPGQDVVAAGTVERGQAIPGYGWPAVVNGMQVVVEEQERERATVLDDGTAGTGSAAGQCSM